MRKVLTLTLGLAALGAFSQQAFAAEKAMTRAECTSDGGIYTMEHNGWTSCMWTDIGVSYNCRTIGCDFVDINAPIKTDDNGIPIKDDKKVAKDNAAREAALKAWEANGKKYTAITTTDKTGTHTIYVKQGVPFETGMQILGPDGRKYDPWDPKLGDALKKAGLVDDRGNPQGFTNDKAMQNELALKRDEEVRKRAIAAGKPIPPPTGHRNQDAWGNPAPKINDHRNDKTKTSSTSSTSSTLNTPPPAAAPGTASTAPTGNTGPTVRDHRKDKPGYVPGGSGGITVTQTPRPAAAGGALQPPSASNATSQK